MRYLKHRLKKNSITKQVDSKKFLKIFFTDTEGLIEIRLIKNAKIKREFFEKADYIPWEKLKKLNRKKYNIYFATCTRKEKSGKKKSVKKIPGLWCDVDAKHFSNKEEAFEHIRCTIANNNIKPTFIIDSGNGYHLYFLFKKPEILESSDDIPRLEGYVKGVSELFGGDYTHDISRVMRLPGFYNMKDPQNPKACEVIRYRPKRRYSLRDFDKYWTAVLKPQCVPDIEIDNMPEYIPERFWVLLRKDNRLKKTWEGERSDLNDTSGSGFDMALADALVKHKFTDGEIARILSDATYSKTNHRTKKYLTYTISKARGLSNKPYPIANDEVEPFPVVFPSKLQKILKQASKAINCPIDFLGLGLLASAGIAIGNSRAIQIKKGWDESPIIYGGIVADPGAKKSPALKFILQPIYNIQKSLKNEYEKEKKVYKEQLAKDKTKSRDWKKSSGKKPLKPEEPIMKQIFTTDSTLEAFAEVLEKNQRGVIFASDELTGWVHAMDQYKRGKGGDRQAWLSFWNKAQVIVNRKNRKEPIVIQEPMVCVIGCLPPDVLSDLSDERGRKDGFIHRIVFTYPKNIQLKWNEDETPEEAFEALDRIFNSLLQIEPDFDENGNIRPRVMAFTESGKKTWRDFIKNHYNEQEDPRFPDNLKGPWAKFEGYAARFALIIQMLRLVCGKTDIEKVDKVSMIGAAHLVTYFKSHARRVYERLSFTPKDKKVMSSLKWIKRNDGAVTARDLQMHRVAGVRTADEAKELMLELQKWGYGNVREGKRKSFLFQLNIFWIGENNSVNEAILSSPLIR